VALSEIDRNLLERCLQRKPRAWEDFVDRFMGLVIHVVNHTARARSIRLSAADRDDLCAEVFLASIKNDFALLRNFRGKSSLATYLTVVARRIVVKELLARMSAAKLGDASSGQPVEGLPDPRPSVEERLGNQEEVQRLLSAVQGTEAQVVRLYHLEGKSYQEISAVVGMPENSIGPILTRARHRMRRAGVDSAAN
jgi:RNA polymerase sigma-70 factor (ECF subfamily)